MTGKDKNELYNLYAEDVVPTKSEDSFVEAGTDVSEPKTFKDNGPDGLTGDGVAGGVADAQELKEDDEKNSQNKEKIAEEDINNCNIMSKSTFDKLYEDVMGNENLMLSQEDDLDGLNGDNGENGEEGGEGLGGEDVTITLSVDQVDLLRDILSQVDGDGEGEVGGEEDLGAMGDEGGMGGLPMDMASTQHEGDVQQEMQVHAEPRSVGNADHLRSTASGGNKASGNVKHTGGSANHGKVKEEPVPKDLGGHGDRSHPDAGNTASGSNKPTNPGTPGVGASLFGN